MNQEKQSIVYELRSRGKEFCDTDGSEHYKHTKIEPMDIIVEEGMLLDFCLANIIKYAARYKKDLNTKKKIDCLDNLKKVADYAHILCGYEISLEEKRNGRKE